jgi:phosphoenolpyruvate phosphomutase
MNDRPCLNASGATLRAALASPLPALLLESHNALSARIAQEAGADGVWVSSLTLSCSYGLPDDESITMDQAVIMLSAIAAAAEVPILFDGDTGYGGPLELARLVRALGHAGVAGVAIEDKVAPKCNSLMAHASHTLATVPEFCQRLRVAKAAQTTGSFVLVARTEALIAGGTIDEALARAEAYVDAGADAVLVHSKAPTFGQVQAFMNRWSRRAPIVCVPTTYAQTPPQAFTNAGIAAVIWANHLMRAAVVAMQQAAAAIVRAQSAAALECSIAPVGELWRLQECRVAAPDAAEPRSSECDAGHCEPALDVPAHAPLAQQLA